MNDPSPSSRPPVPNFAWAESIGQGKPHRGVVGRRLRGKSLPLFQIWVMYRPRKCTQLCGVCFSLKSESKTSPTKPIYIHTRAKLWSSEEEGIITNRGQTAEEGRTNVMAELQRLQSSSTLHRKRSGSGARGALPRGASTGRTDRTTCFPVSPTARPTKTCCARAYLSSPGEREERGERTGRRSFHI